MQKKDLYYNKVMAKFEEKSIVVLNLLSEGYNMTDAAKKANISKDTLYEWIKTKTDFSDAVKRAKEEGEQKAVRDVEAALLDLAKGREWEEVVTEYEGRPNPKYDPNDPDSGDPVIPVIKKQRRVRKHIPPSADAIKFYLTNKRPDIWKNRQQQEIANLDLLKNLRVEQVGSKDDEGLIVNSEDDIKD